jgi:hypothetical protein
MRSSILWTASVLVAVGALVGCGSPVVSELPVPPADQGFQQAITPFTVPQGHEVQACFFFAVPGTPGQDVWVNRFQIADSLGSHHVSVFRVKTISNLSGKPGDSVFSMDGTGPCYTSSNWSDWPLVMNSQIASDTDWQLPDGVGEKFQPGELLMLQVHFVNATTQKTPGLAKAAINFYYPKTIPQNEMGTLFATNQNIRICPGDEGKSFTKTCHFGATTSVHIIGANGHFHSRGTEFDMMCVDQTGGLIDQFYKSTQWDDPLMARNFDQVVPAGGGVEWKCTYDFPQGGCGNPNDSCCFTFGGLVETQEHCNAFVYYYPKTQDINCF